jgi:hypothetical protein
MRNLTNRGLDFYSPQRTISFRRSFQPLLDRKEVRYLGKDNLYRVIGRMISRAFMLAGRSVRDPRAIAVLMLMVMVFAIPSVVMVGSKNSEASIFPINVRGYIMDLSGNKLQGANVTVEMVNETSGFTTKTLYYDSTTVSGLYSVTFDGAYWNPGDTIRVTAKYDLDTQVNQTTARNVAMQYVNVTMAVEIPEFGSLFGISTYVLSVGMVASVIILYRRKNRGPGDASLDP